MEEVEPRNDACHGMTHRDKEVVVSVNWRRFEMDPLGDGVGEGGGTIVV